ncbi:MAG: three-Cys-motif partner protein TcmP [Acidobacteriota bacterium]
MSEANLYEGREQTLVKHLILGKYLERFAIIIGFNWSSITYVDCFSGPWKSRSQELKDTSFAIALAELRKARETHRARGSDIRLRCFFLEKKPAAYARLEQYADQITDVEIKPHKGELESSIQAILDFVGQDANTFPFIFIDPTGWTGFAMQDIGPLLKLNPGEALINFITGHIKRFIESPQDQTRESFIRLFGSADFKSRIEGLAKQDREDALVAEYCESVKRTGRFKHVSPAIVLHPEKDRTHFNLIYATRHDSGLDAFKDAEKRAMKEMEHARAEAQRRRREQMSGMRDLFSSDLSQDSNYYSTYYESLRTRYLSPARDSVEQALRAKRRLPYDTAWALALAHPLTWESDLKDWIAAWVDKPALKIEGLIGRQRVPQREKGHTLVWITD